MLLLVLFSCYTVSLRASVNNKQQCCWLSMSIGSSVGTAVKSAALVAAPFGLAVLAYCGPRLLPLRLSVLPGGIVPDITSTYMPWYV